MNTVSKNSFGLGFSSFFRAFGFMFKHGLWWWYLVPVLLWALVFGSIVKIISGYAGDYVSDNLFSWLHLTPENDPSGFWHSVLNLLKIGAKYTIIFLVHLFIWIITSRITKYLVLIICSPILAYLSEKCEEIITGNSYPFNINQFLKDIIRGILITLRNLFLELICISTGAIISFFIPVLSPLIAAALFIVSSYFMGFSMFDYYSERKKLNISQSVKFINARAWTVIGVGVAYNLIDYIPILSWTISPINGCIGAVLCEEDN